jgi:hypothetical protein
VRAPAAWRDVETDEARELPYLCEFGRTTTIGEPIEGSKCDVTIGHTLPGRGRGRNADNSDNADNAVNAENWIMDVDIFPDLVTG